MAVHADSLLATSLLATGATYERAFWPLFLLAFKAADRILRDTPAAEDVAADVMGRLHLRWARLGEATYREAWVVRVATNRAIDVVRRGAAPLQQASPSIFEDQVASRVALTTALAKLPRRQREAVALHYLVGLSEAEVARVLGVGVGSVRRHINRALTRLRGEFR